MPLLSFSSLAGRRSAKYEEALEKFESVLGSRPDPTEASVASYNVACCYSKLNQVLYYFTHKRNVLLHMNF